MSNDLQGHRSSYQDLASWLQYIESLHPKSIAMGLERITRMIERLQLNPAFKIITVAGTNGKGSTCAMLEQIYLQAGFSVGCYTSPHLLRYNERVRVNGHELTDEALCKAFSVIDAARNSHDEIQLTYFEVGTLAAMWHFMHAVEHKLDVVILEIGLGGRLDAVNAFVPDCAIVTSVDLDHQEFLGDTREAIGFEKAGVFRALKPAICGDTSPPNSLVQYAKKIHANFKTIHQDFGIKLTENGWQYTAHGTVVYSLPLPALQGDYQLINAACAVAAVESLQICLPVSEAAIGNGLRKVKVAGRFQILHQHNPGKISTTLIFDVAHNPHAAKALAQNLNGYKNSGKTFAVFAMLADKDIRGVVEAVMHEIDAWYVATIDHVRGEKAENLAGLIAAIQPQAQVKTFHDAYIAYQHARIDLEACNDVNENDKIVVFGSFFTVSTVMQHLALN
ncbi:MAG: bifunctional tetrahydrofolate synthase/dihydrofolate synthase [Methylotenera sp.]